MFFWSSLAFLMIQLMLANWSLVPLPFLNPAWTKNKKLDNYGGVEGHVLIFSCENSKITTRWWTIINKRMLDPTKKDTPRPRAKEKPQQDTRRGEIMFRIKPHSCKGRLEGSNKPCVHQDPETPQRLDFHRELERILMPGFHWQRFCFVWLWFQYRTYKKLPRGILMWGQVWEPLL